MKRDLKITLPFILILVLLASCSNQKYFTNELNVNSLWTINTDTSSLISLLETDSFKLPVIPPSSGVQFYKDGIVFLSMSKYDKKMTPKQISFGTISCYYAPVQDSVAGKRNAFSTSSAFPYPSEGMTFSRNYDTVYFTKLARNDDKEKIFMAMFPSDGQNVSGLIEEKSPLDFCTGNYSYSHPTLSSDGKMLIFASDKNGTLGGMDLFITRKVGNKWSSSENLGNSINTEGNEFFPFLDSENNLFFSSDRQPGYGGYDIFTCKYNGKGWNSPMNLSDRINSDKDEIAFTINKTDGKTAFFTRKLRSAIDGMQLFKVSVKKDAAGQKLLTVVHAINRKSEPATGLIAASKVTEGKEVKGTKVSETIPATVKPATEVSKKEEKIAPETTSVTNKAAENITSNKPETKKKATDLAAANTRPAVSSSSDQKAEVVYRVQIFSSTAKKSDKEIMMNGNNYNLYEYLYLGAYRYTVGEFNTLKPAVELQKLCRQSGYPQAFVVAFKDNTRSLEMNLFK